MGTPSQSYGTSLAIWDYTVLPTTRHNTSERAPPNPSRAGWYSIYLSRRDGRLSWPTVVDLIAPRPGVEPATFRSQVRRRTAAPPRQPKCKIKRHFVELLDSLFWDTVYRYELTMLPVSAADADMAWTSNSGPRRHGLYWSILTTVIAVSIGMHHW